jgi:flagellar basal-body rod modification protein FlgD
MEGISQLNTNLTNMMSLEQLTQSASLLGKTVNYTPTGTGTPTSGVVSSVNLVNGQAQLSVGSDTVSLSQISGMHS